MTANEYLREALGGNMNISTLKPLAIEKLMESYAKHRTEILEEENKTLRLILIDDGSCPDCLRHFNDSLQTYGKLDECCQKSRDSSREKEKQKCLKSK